MVALVQKQLEWVVEEEVLGPLVLVAQALLLVMEVLVETILVSFLIEEQTHQIQQVEQEEYLAVVEVGALIIQLRVTHRFEVLEV
jgi:hypothetical protein